MALYEAQQLWRDGHRVVAANMTGRNPAVFKSLAQFSPDMASIDCERTGLGLDAAPC